MFHDCYSASSVILLLKEDGEHLLSQFCSKIAGQLLVSESKAKSAWGENLVVRAMR